MSLENFTLKVGWERGGVRIFRNGGLSKVGGVVFEMGGLNPSTNYADCLGVSKLLFSMNRKTSLKMVLSNIIPQIGKRETGW